MNTNTSFLLRIIHRISTYLLDNPYLFNYVRYLLAGKQTKMKQFISHYLNTYQCISVIDICSGTGDFAELVAKKSSYLGVDLNDDFIRFAKRRYKGQRNKKFINADILSNDFPKEKFDAVLLISMLHHFSDKELLEILPQVRKMTKKIVIVADIIPNPPHMLQKFFAKIDRGRYVRPADKKLRLLKKYFTILTTEEIPTRSAVQFGIVCEPKKKV